jgi:thiol-disulfide isomerase/thioredoxin
MRQQNKKFIFVFFIIILFSSVAFSQDYKFIDDGDETVLVGITSRTVYQDSNFADWFNMEYTNYKVDTKLIQKIGATLEGKLIKIVLGTWCSDSRREVPRFVKILDFIDFPFDKVLFINVDREKKGLDSETTGLNVEFVPTFIFYQDGTELGRIVESPIESLEKDLLNIPH